MEWITIGVAVIMGGIVLAIAYRKYTRDSVEARRRFGLGDVADDDSLWYEGYGAETTPPVYLKAGNYKVMYQFSDTALIKLEMLNLGDGDQEVVVLKSGAGTASFALEQGGRYQFSVEAADDDAEWEFEISRLGLPSRQAAR